MSLFDVLKYPISDPPQVGEISSLPDVIFRAWVDNPKCSWVNVPEDSRYSREWVDSWVHIHWGDSPSESRSNQRDMVILRKVIKEYEPL